jgi:hypothetical protein
VYHGCHFVPRIVPLPSRRRALDDVRERGLRPLERRAHVVVEDDPVALKDADGLVPSGAPLRA